MQTPTKIAVVGGSHSQATLLAVPFQQTPECTLKIALTTNATLQLDSSDVEIEVVAPGVCPAMPCVQFMPQHVVSDIIETVRRAAQSHESMFEHYAKYIFEDDDVDTGVTQFAYLIVHNIQCDHETAQLQLSVLSKADQEGVASLWDALHSSTACVLRLKLLS